MARTTGKRLQEARLTRGLDLEDVQHLTHIRAAQIAAMENDDLSVFPDPVYARGFYASYARFLGVDLTEFLNTLPSRPNHQRGSCTFLRPMALAIPPARRGRPKPGDPPPGPARMALVGTASVLVVTATAWFSHLYWHRHDPRLDGATVTGTSASLPIITGSSAPKSPDSPPETGLTPSPPAQSPTPIDVRATPPPILKALPVDDAGGPLSHESPGPRPDPPATPEIRRPDPITR